MREPLDKKLDNPGHYDFYTCPACYNDLGAVGEGTHKCTDCSATVKCYRGSQPVCHSELVQPDDQQETAA